ncbi:predicted protein [Sclerotinia sclerotiorum 1980 UF-70]|uniref:Glucose-methanol-choline oxidoreductase C-terminal domain-containing protein n=1 Tax=Sclerotinia sclerotiorum (strain ATCC 18683 / 1980 / Ss-1) TaxID=665079 RepID=A7ESV4_SCLS1|nr:predicted protein [Sclerotinia sclerotiorum 1980 UF-70]EDN92546.1 predicted protein [Sclerotinia sclerotiorum 1980 UF-70]
MDERIRARGDILLDCCYGKVVDSSLCVYGVQELPVVDASVIPLPIAAHYQACTCALSEQAADITGASV